MKLLSGTGSKQRYSRITGFFYLFVMATSTFGIMTFSGLPSLDYISDIYPEMNAADMMYRLEFRSLLLSSMGTLVLAYASYLIVSSFAPKLSVVVLITRFAEAVLFAVYAAVRYVSIAHGPHTHDGYDPMYGSFELTPLQEFGGLVFNWATLCFGIGSAVFFYLLLRSRYIPRLLSLLGLAGALLVLLVCVISLIYRNTQADIWISWLPIAVAEFVIALWLLVIGAKTSSVDSR